MRKLILITIIAMTSIGCPSKNKNGSGGQVAVHPNNINGNCQNSYYNPQTGQQTSYNPANGYGTNSYGTNCGYNNGGFGGYGNNFYGAPVTRYGIQCYAGYYAVYNSNGSGCVAATWVNSYATNAYVYSYYNSYWNYAGYYGNYNSWGPSSAFMGCSGNFSGCNCSFINNTGFGVCI
ncbi:MAG: hypothetical protein SGJ18_11010 [Pseudomonadota bacterium]|nr:hypothetical protein [Pseudomonadota bacterium]